MQIRRGKFYLTRWDGERVRWLPLGASYSEALRQYAELEGFQPEGRTVGDLIDRFLTEHVPGLADDTAREYRRSAGTLRAVFGTMHVANVQQSHVARYLDEHQAPSQANHDIAVLSSMFRKAIRWGWLEDKNPCKGVQRNATKKRKRLMTAGELDALRAAAREPVRCIIDLAFLTALRKADLLKIRLSDITDEGLMVTIQKTGDPVVFAACDELDAVLTRARALHRRVSSMFLFSTRDGQPYTKSGFDSMFQRVKKKAGLEGVTFHDIRARRLTLAARERGKEYAQALASHASVVTTERYIRGREVKEIQL